ncbi:MAG: DUF1624 domain-containing protein [Lachnospiraceae bacterium]|nr:DUF1624 domain-containing protein [Lachnospiraceae bacterium]
MNVQTLSPTTAQDPAGTARPPALSGRLILLDELRGLTLISMILYHFMWDLYYIVGITFPWKYGMYAPGMHIWQQSICWTFILLSGFCWSLGHHPFRRGMIVFGCGLVVTAVTVLFVPEYLILFGVLTLIGSSMLFMIPFDFVLKRLIGLRTTRDSAEEPEHTAGRAPIMALLMTALFFALFWWTLHHGQTLWPQSFPRNLLTTYLGFPFAGFWSTDYFSVIPWFFLYVTGYLLHAVTVTLRLPETFRARLQDIAHTSHLPALAFLGRHCLLVYMLHQPVLYGIACVVAYI